MGKMPLHWAIRLGHIRVAETLLKKDQIDVNLTDECGETPLHYALQRECVELLLQKEGIDVNKNPHS
jgi:ankyrin repeat protein